jgi:hypothetical protein
MGEKINQNKYRKKYEPNGSSCDEKEEGGVCVEWKAASAVVTTPGTRL